MKVANAHEFRVSTWEECEAKVAEIEKANTTSHTKLLFRGQRDSKWRLDTTLERRIPRSIPVIEYYRTMFRIMPEIATYVGTSFVLPNFAEISTWSKDFDNFTLRDLPAYDCMVYLRHHGFPSPLLDWSLSLYVAAYFAFSQPVGDDVAIFIFSESPNNMKHSASSLPQIHKLGPYVKTHRRHFRQRSSYTFCATFDPGTGVEFSSHQSVFDLGLPDKDVLWKVVLPAKERLKVLTHLDKYNLNAFSLFDSEESLMEMLAFREIDLKQSWGVPALRERIPGPRRHDRQRQPQCDLAPRQRCRHACHCRPPVAASMP